MFMFKDRGDGDMKEKEPEEPDSAPATAGERLERPVGSNNGVARKRASSFEGYRKGILWNKLSERIKTQSVGMLALLFVRSCLKVCAGIDIDGFVTRSEDSDFSPRRALFCRADELGDKFRKIGGVIFRNY